MAIDYSTGADVIHCGGDADVITGSTIEIGRDEVRHKDLVVFGGSVRMYGEIFGDVVLFGGDHEINGKVHGDAVVFGGNISVQAEAEISGDLVSLGGNILKHENAQIGGDIVDLGFIPFFDKIKWNEMRDFGDLKVMLNPLKGLLLSLKIIGLIFLLAITLVIAALAPKKVEFASEELKTEWWKALLLGIGVAIAVFVLAILFAVTVIGIPLAFLLWLAWLATKWFGLAALFLFVGKNVSKNLFHKDPQPLVSILIAFAFYVVISLVPILGGLIRWLVACMAVGLMILTKYGCMSSWMKAKVIEVPETIDREKWDEVAEQEEPTAKKKTKKKKKAVKKTVKKREE